MPGREAEREWGRGGKHTWVSAASTHTHACLHTQTRPHAHTWPCCCKLTKKLHVDFFPVLTCPLLSLRTKSSVQTFLNMHSDAHTCKHVFRYIIYIYIVCIHISYIHMYIYVYGDMKSYIWQSLGPCWMCFVTIENKLLPLFLWLTVVRRDGGAFFNVGSTSWCHLLMNHHILTISFLV